MKINSTSFVDRDIELGKIDETLSRLTAPHKTLSKQIIEFNGIGGVGKSALLSKSIQKCQEKRNLRYSVIDFADFLADGTLHVDLVANSIVQQISIESDSFDRTLNIAFEENSARNSTNYLISSIKQILQGQDKIIPLVLIFDSVDEIDKAGKEWLISVIDGTIDAGKILYALASKTAIGFSKIPRLDRKAFSFHLMGLDQQYTLRQIQVYSPSIETQELSSLAQEVFKLTQGHPFANQVVVEEACSGNHYLHNILYKQSELIQLINEKVLNKKVFHKYKSEEVKRFKTILTPLSIPRMINLVSMRVLIENFASDFVLETTWHYSNYIRELQAETSFIFYSKEKSAYMVDPMLGNIFSLTLKNEDPVQFNAINRLLVEMYENWIRNAKGTDKTKFFLEKIYHQLCLGISFDSLASQFESFSNLIGENLSKDERQGAKQQFVEEFTLDADLKNQLDESAQQKIAMMFR